MRPIRPAALQGLDRRSAWLGVELAGIDASWMRAEVDLGVNSLRNGVKPRFGRRR